MNKNNIANLCNYLDNNAAQRYPISNSELSDSADYIKNGYLKMLAVVLQRSVTISDAQLDAFKRIVSGAKTDKSVEEYLRMALDITIEDYIEFSNECKDLTLKYRWVLDALVITCVQQQSEEQLRLIAQFIESYGITKSELEYIAAMARAIIEMDGATYLSAYEMKEDSVPDTVFYDYKFLVLDKCVYSNDNITIFQQTQKQKITTQMLEKIEEINTPCIKIIGAHINVGDCALVFKNKEKVILEDCSFVGGIKNGIGFISCGEVEINHCRFEKFSTRTIIFEKINKIWITDSEFVKCRIYSGGEKSFMEFGGVLYSNKPSEIGVCNLIDTSFTDCGAIREDYLYYGFSALISNIDSVVDGCSFTNTNCWCMRSKDTISSGRGTGMFTDESSARNCTFNNSEKFNNR